MNTETDVASHNRLQHFPVAFFSSAVFIALLLALQLPRFARLRFFLSWWAYSFPLAALTIATLFMFRATGVALFKAVSYLLLVLLCGVIALLLALTTRAIAQRDLHAGAVAEKADN